MITLRPYQADAIERLREAIRHGHRRILIVAPTGSGKTTIAASIILGAIKKGRKALFLAHRRELVVQSYNRLLGMGIPDTDIGIIMAQDHRTHTGASVQVASIQTLMRRTHPPADIVITDEAHRCLAPTYGRVADHYADALHLGLTATPYRRDGGGLGERYDDLIIVSSPQQHIDEGYLVAPRAFLAPPEARPDLSSVRTVRGDYDQAQSAMTMSTVELVGGVVANWRRLADGMSTVCFAVNVAHSRMIQAAFEASGVCAEHIDGETPTGVRDAVLGRLGDGTTTVVSNCGILCEGWDMPSVKCAILARPTKSLGLYLQQAGRILRPYRDQGAIILDHAGNILRHGLPQEERKFTLIPSEEPEEKKNTTRICSRCGAVMPIATKACPECGYVFPRPPPREIIEVQGDLEEYKPPAHREWKKKLDVFRGVQKRMGYKPGWVYYRMIDEFGHIPAGYRW